jgi:hypothetical protein
MRQDVSKQVLEKVGVVNAVLVRRVRVKPSFRAMGLANLQSGSVCHCPAGGCQDQSHDLGNAKKKPRVVDGLTQKEKKTTNPHLTAIHAFMTHGKRKVPGPQLDLKSVRGHFQRPKHNLRRMSHNSKYSTYLPVGEVPLQKKQPLPVHHVLQKPALRPLMQTCVQHPESTSCANNRA